MDSSLIIMFQHLQSFLDCKEEIEESMKNINSSVNKTFQSCLKECMNNNNYTVDRLDIESILDYLHDELNTGHWSEISVDVRRAFTAASYIKTLVLLKSSTTCSQNVFEECIKSLDIGLLLGAPLEKNSELLTKCASYLSRELAATFHNSNDVVNRSKEKRKIGENIPQKFTNLEGVMVDTLSCPSLETFNSKYFTKQLPVKLQECMSHWPAVSKWTDVNYLLRLAGERTVPIEIGSHYADENWCQKLMTLKDFIKNYFLGTSDNVGYLAQHNLFNQIPELRNDIYIPDYCCLGESDEDPDINAWFGPEGTTSPLHFDPKNNILTQVFGTKLLILYSPKDSCYLYPHDSTLLSNTAQVDPFNMDNVKYPNCDNAVAYKCILEPGEMLYIPPKWWHHVIALDKSFSVSFWWN